MWLMSSGCLASASSQVNLGQDFCDVRLCKLCGLIV